MTEYIVRESGYPGTIKKEIVGEIVRCKDCKWFDRTNPYGTLSPNAFHCNANERFFRDDFYCAYGERRE